MKLIFCFVFAIEIFVVLAQSGSSASGQCIATDDVSDLQLFPSCSMRQMISKAMDAIRPFLKNFPFASKDQCIERTKGVVTDIVDNLAPCIKGTCDQNLLTLVLKETLDSEQYGQFENISVADLKSMINTAWTNVTSDTETFDFICPKAGERPLFMIFLPASLNATDLSQGVLQSIETVIGMLFNSPSAMESKAADESQCSFFKNNLQNVMNNFDVSQMIGSALPSGEEGAAAQLALAGTKDYIKTGQSMLITELEGLFCDTGDNNGSTSLPSLLSSVFFGCLLVAHFARLV